MINKKMQWDKDNLTQVHVAYRKEFVAEFKEACKKLNISQSEVIRKAMEEVINKSKEEA